jgi:hypothetical protein
MNENVRKDINRVMLKWGEKEGWELYNRLLRLEEKGKEVEWVEVYKREGKMLWMRSWLRVKVMVVGEVKVRRWYWRERRWVNS